MNNMRINKLAGNIFSLAAVQAIDYVVPMLAIPYLLRVVGIDGYGRIAFTQATLVFFIVLIDYGFGWSATKRVASLRLSGESVNNLFWQVQCTKIFLLTGSALVLTLLILFVPSFGAYNPVICSGYILMLGATFFPLWLYQGLGMVKSAAVALLGFRILSLILIFLFVKNEDDAFLAAMLQSMPMLFAGLILIVKLKIDGVLHFRSTEKLRIRQELISGWPAFSASAASLAYRSSNPVFLGVVMSPNVVAYYSVAEKIVKAVQELLKPVSQATYPRVMELACKSREETVRFLRRLFLFVGASTFVGSIAIVIASPRLVGFLMGEIPGDAVLLVAIMAFIPFVGGLNMVLGMQAMFAFDYGKDFSRRVVIAGVLGLCVFFPLIYIFGVAGAGISYLFSEIILLLLLVIFHKRRKTGVYQFWRFS